MVARVGELPSQRTVDVLNTFCQKKIEPFINKSYDELSDYLQCYEKTLVMKRECIAERGIWTAKKRYILNVWDNEGVRYVEPKLKMMGIEAVKSSTPAPCRQYIKECLNIMTGQKELIDYIENNCTEHKFPVELRFLGQTNNLGKFSHNATIYGKSTPIHVRGSLFNHFIKEKEVFISTTQSKMVKRSSSFI